MKQISLIIWLVLSISHGFSQDLYNEIFSRQRVNVTPELLDSALQVCDSILLLEPNNIDAQYSKAMVYYYREQNSESRKEFKELLKLDSSLADVYYNIALTHMNESREFRFFSKYGNEDLSNEHAYWECNGSEEECLKTANTIYPLIQRFLELETKLIGEDSLYFNRMLNSLEEYIEENE